MIRELPIDLIDARPDARSIDEATVAGLADSIADVGLINPIRVRANGGRWEVLTGLHRLAAHKSIGLTEILASVVQADDLHAELAMIDENLMRAELSPSERATQTARRRAIYLALHPETAQHVAGGKARHDTASDNLSFANATAEATGRDKRSVQRDAERGEKVIQAAIDVIKGSSLDTGTYLDKLKRLSPSEQVYAAKRDLAHAKAQERERERQKAAGIARRIVKVADEPLTDDEAAERQYAALVSAWNKAGENARQRFRELIDQPVMDHRFGPEVAGRPFGQRAQ